MSPQKRPNAATWSDGGFVRPFSLSEKSAESIARLLGTGAYREAIEIAVGTCMAFESARLSRPSRGSVSKHLQALLSALEAMQATIAVLRSREDVFETLEDAGYDHRTLISFSGALSDLHAIALVAEKSSPIKGANKNLVAPMLMEMLAEIWESATGEWPRERTLVSEREHRGAFEDLIDIIAPAAHIDVKPHRIHDFLVKTKHRRK